MGPAVKFLVGLAAVLLLGWLYHGPLGNGEARLARIEDAARQVVAQSEVANIAVRMERDPPMRIAILSGPADQFQRRGQGSLPGLSQLVDNVDGVAAVQWADEPAPSQFVLPLLAELLIPLLIAYLIGLGLAWFVRRRRAARE
jgi:hypothetical protein